MQNQFKVQRTGSGAGHGTRLLFMAPIGTKLHCDAYESAVGHARHPVWGEARSLAFTICTVIGPDLEL